LITVVVPAVVTVEVAGPEQKVRITPFLPVLYALQVELTFLAPAGLVISNVVDATSPTPIRRELKAATTFGLTFAPADFH
jgi:hypothetical protein